MTAEPAPRCLLEGCPSPQQTSVTLRVDGRFRVVGVCRRHATAYAAAVEARQMAAAAAS